jgi:CubicO group peptidase (beta-lactamase class C family)
MKRNRLWLPSMLASSLISFSSAARQPLPRSTSEAQGPEAPDKPHVLYSLSKSFNSTAVGLAIAEGKLSLEDPVLKFFPGEAPAEPSENLKAMKVRDLLTMTCGHDTEAKSARGAPAVKDFLAQPVPHKPGTRFLYNTLGATPCPRLLRRQRGKPPWNF